MNNSNPASPGAPVIPPPSCPRQAARRAAAIPSFRRWVAAADLHQEPFRIFFPAAALAGLIGVGLWPVMILGWTSAHPGPSHARLMVQGLFGGFIFGFLGTAMPRLVEGSPLKSREAFPLLALFLANVAANTVGWNAVGDMLFASQIILWFRMLRSRCHGGNSQPPPTFALVGLSFAAALAGAALHLAGAVRPLPVPMELLARLLGFHAFVLLCILGAGGFLLPRFLGLGLRRKPPASATESALVKAVGLAILATYGLEAAGSPAVSGSLRAALVVGYLFYQIPLERLRWTWSGVQPQLVAGLACVPLGVLAAGLIPAARLGMLHLELVGGFALITTGIATRVVFGHSGGRERLNRFHLGLTVASLLMLIGLASRISADFMPESQITHYLYAALCWMAGMLVWAVSVLPRVLRPDSEP